MQDNHSLVTVGLFMQLPLDAIKQFNRHILTVGETAYRPTIQNLKIHKIFEELSSIKFYTMEV